MSLLAGALFGVIKGGILVVFTATVGASSRYFLSKFIGRPLVSWLWPEKLRYFQSETKFLYPRSCEKWILKSIGRDWRQYRATLKKSLFNVKQKRSMLYRRCLEDVDEDQWVILVNHWKSKKWEGT